MKKPLLAIFAAVAIASAGVAQVGALTIPITVIPSPSPTTTTPPGVSEIDTPQDMQAIANKFGSDAGNGASTTTYPWDRDDRALGFANVRGSSTVNSFPAEFTDYLTNPNIRGAHCGSFSEVIYKGVSDYLSGAATLESALTNGASPTSAAGQAAIACSDVDLQNEYDSTSVQALGTLSTAVAAGGTATENFPTTASCNSTSNIGPCAASASGGTVYLDVDYGSSNEEEVQLLPSTTTSTWTATFTKAHSTSAPVRFYPPYEMAYAQHTAWTAITTSSTYSGMQVNSIPYAGPINNLPLVDAAEMQFDGKHEWQESNALHFHMSQCNGAPTQSGYQTYITIFSRMEANVGLTSYPWSVGADIGEAIVDAQPDAFGNGTANQPNIPVQNDSNGGGCNLPQLASAIYEEFGPVYISALNLPIAQMNEPVLYDGASGTLNNSYADVVGRPKMNWFVAREVRNFLSDLNYNPATYSPANLQFYRPNSSLWVTAFSSASSNGSTYTTTAAQPSGANIFHLTFSDQTNTHYVMFIQQMQSGGLWNQQTLRNPDNTYQTGNYPGIPAPTMVPTLTPTSQTLYVGSGIQNVNVYQFSNFCDAPTNVESTMKPSDGTPDTTPSPTYQTGNTACMPLNLVGSYSASGGYVTVPVSIGNSAEILDMTTGATPLPTMTVPPMPAVIPTPSSGYQWNLMRSGGSPVYTVFTG